MIRNSQHAKVLDKGIDKTVTLIKEYSEIEADFTTDKTIEVITKFVAQFSSTLIISHSFNLKEIYEKYQNNILKNFISIKEVRDPRQLNDMKNLIDELNKFIKEIDSHQNSQDLLMDRLLPLKIQEISEIIDKSKLLLADIDKFYMISVFEK